MFRSNRIRIEDEYSNGFANFRFGRSMIITLSTVLIGGALILAFGNGVKAENGSKVQVAMVETVAVTEIPAVTTAQPVQAPRKVRVIPLFNIPDDQKASVAR